MPVQPSPPPCFRRYVIPIVLVWLASAAFRWWQYDERQVASNIGASYHVLLTVRAMNSTPASTHHFLPIVTLGRPLDRDVPFGATIHAPDGIYYCTSFPPLGFIAPWAFFKVTTLQPTLRNLMAFNLMLHLGATLLLALLVAEAVGSDSDGGRHSASSGRARRAFVSAQFRSAVLAR